MRVKIIFLLILFSIKSNCQLKRITKYYDKQINAENQDNAVSIYKIKGKKYITDRKTFFSSNNGYRYLQENTATLHFMLYKKRYLFVGYFFEIIDGMSGFSNETRLIEQLKVFDLENPTRKWSYQFNKKTSMNYVKSFNPADGKITYCNHRKPEKVITD